MDGFILIDKEKDMTSFDVVFKVKKILQTKKVGHTGTLDPNTTGLLVIALGRATKMIPILTKNSQKTYHATAKFGLRTDSLDITGNVLEEKAIKRVDKEELIKTMNSFLGPIIQIPPIYSAKKVNGKRLYEYARNDEEVTIKEHKVEIFDINLLEFDGESFIFESKVSKGTYIRSLIVDIADKTDNIAVMTKLRRTETDGFNVTDAVKLEELNTSHIIDLEEFVKNRYPVYPVYGPIGKMIRNGAMLRIRDGIEYPCLYTDQETGACIAIYDIFEGNTKPIMMF